MSIWDEAALYAGTSGDEDGPPVIGALARGVAQRTEHAAREAARVANHVRLYPGRTAREIADSLYGPDRARYAANSVRSALREHAHEHEGRWYATPQEPAMSTAAENRETVLTLLREAGPLGSSSTTLLGLTGFNKRVLYETLNGLNDDELAWCFAPKTKAARWYATDGGAACASNESGPVAVTSPEPPSEAAAEASNPSPPAAAASAIHGESVAERPVSIDPAQAAAEDETPWRVQLRPEVRWFAELMEMKLRTHDGDRGARGWVNDDNYSLLERVQDELSEARHAKTLPQRVGECVDVANMAMMAADACWLMERTLLGQSTDHAERDPEPPEMVADALATMDETAARAIEDCARAWRSEDETRAELNEVRDALGLDHDAPLTNVLTAIGEGRAAESELSTLRIRLAESQSREARADREVALQEQQLIAAASGRPPERLARWVAPWNDGLRVLVTGEVLAAADDESTHVWVEGVRIELSAVINSEAEGAGAAAAERIAAERLAGVSCG